MSLFKQPTPPAPDAGISAAGEAGTQQQGFNVASQAGSMVGQQNPFGSLSWQQTGTGPGGVPLYTANTSLAPQQQNLLDIQNLNRGIMGSGAAGLLGTANYGGSDPTSAIGSMTSGLTGQMLGAELGYLNPFFNLQKSQQDAQLENQGFTPGTAAYNNAMLPTLTGQDLSMSNFLANAQPQAFQEATNLYQMPLGMSQLMMANAAPTMPGTQFVQTPQLGNVNSIGAYGTAQNAAEQAYQAKQAQYNAMINGMFALGSAALGGMTGGLGGGLLGGLGGGMLGGITNAANNAFTGAVPGMPNYATAANPYNPFTNTYGIQ